jgi:hypothetical protein
LAAGARYEVQKTIRELEPEVSTVRFSAGEGELVPLETESVDAGAQVVFLSETPVSRTGGQPDRKPLTQARLLATMNIPVGR